MFPTAKLLVLPVLFYHFERSGRGVWVMIAFLVSCTLMMILSWAVTCAPYLTMKPAADASRGIFVKNYIDQSQEFTLCAVALAFPVVQLLRAGKIWQAVALCVLGVSLIANMVFVVVSRTALVTLPILFAAFGLLHLRLRANCSCSVRPSPSGLSPGSFRLDVWSASRRTLRGASAAATRDERRAARNADLAVTRMDLRTFARDYQLYEDEQVPTSFGERLTYWK